MLFVRRLWDQGFELAGIQSQALVPSSQQEVRRDFTTLILNLVLDAIDRKIHNQAIPVTKSIPVLGQIIEGFKCGLISVGGLEFGEPGQDGDLSG